MWLQRFRHEVMTVAIRMVQLEWLIQEIHEVMAEFCNWQGRPSNRIERLWAFESETDES